jgi:hypothetical protein
MALVVVGLMTAAFLSDRDLAVGRLSVIKSADVLEERAREILARAGHTSPPADEARGVSMSGDYLNWVRTKAGAAEQWNTITSGNSAMMRFWYRSSPRPLVPSPQTWQPTLTDPAFAIAGMSTVVVDERGRLQEFVVMPPQLEPAPAAEPPIDWSALFAEAELPFAQFSPVTPQWTPRVFADQRIAWEGPMRGHPDTKIRVEAAAYRGRPVAFQTIWPWTRPARTERLALSASQRAFGMAGTLLLLALLAGAVGIARFNLKSGRADARGASRIALFLIGVWTLSWLLGARHRFELDGMFDLFFGALAFILLNVGFTWLFYLALEPFVRKLRPEILISWSRLLAGQVRDPRVCRDVLIGVTVGVTMVVIGHFDSLVLPWLTGTIEEPQLSSAQYLLGARFTLSALVRTLPNSLQAAMIGTFAYVMLLLIVRKAWIANTLIVTLLTAVIVAEDGAFGARLWGVLVLAICFAAPMIAIFLRFGLLSFAAGLMTIQALGVVPLTLDLEKPHGAVSALVMIAVLALAGYAFHASRAGAGLMRRLLPA